MSRLCLNCGKEVTGRIDKLYCGQYCKSIYHYKKKKEASMTEFKRIDLILKRNRRLLKHYNTAGQATIRKEKLLAAGFDFNYFTHYWRNPAGKPYIFCYDVGYFKKDTKGPEKYVLVDHQEYMKRD